MKVFGLALDLRDDPQVIADYERYHREVWPDIQRAMRAVGVESQRIFRSGNRLFLVMETRDDFDWERDFARYLESTSQAREWDALMHGYQQVVPAAQPGEWWSVMKEVYNLNDQLARLDATPPGKSP